MQLLVYPVTVFFPWYARNPGFSHMYTDTGAPIPIVPLSQPCPVSFYF